jgi:hypothetical protein
VLWRLRSAGCAGAQLVERDQLFWYASIKRVIALSARVRSRSSVSRRRGGGAAGCSVRSLDAAVNIAADELRVLEQLPDYPPDELVGADRADCADAPAEVPPAVPADAEVEEIRLLLVRV